MTLSQLQKYIKNQLGEKFNSGEQQQLVYLIVESVVQIPRIYFHSQPDLIVGTLLMDRINEIIGLLQKDYPIQYILGKTEFMGLPIQVNPQVLIPRQETEELVDWIVKSYTKKSPSILDVGTGSGCIAIALKKLIPGSMVTAFDISLPAIETAKQNAILNQVDIRFEQKDILQNLNISEKFDLIVSNPPYVTASEKEQMHSNVLEHEPYLALFVSDDDPLLFYRKIAEFALASLTDRGFLFFEINERYGNSIIEMLKNFKFENIELRSDLNARPRMIKAQKI